MKMSRDGSMLVYSYVNETWGPAVHTGGAGFVLILATFLFFSLFFLLSMLVGYLVVVVLV
jgi:hypothetical protein